MIRTACRVAGSGVIGAAVGFLTRPCCLGPALLSVLGVSSVGLGDGLAEQREVLIAFAGMMLGATLWINLRRDGGWFNKSFAVAAAATGFGWSMRVLGIW